jgi:hypothetical protein
MVAAMQNDPAIQTGANFAPPFFRTHRKITNVENNVIRIDNAVPVGDEGFVHHVLIGKGPSTVLDDVLVEKVSV